MVDSSFSQDHQVIQYNYDQIGYNSIEFKKILIVDDQSFNLDAAKVILQHGVNLANIDQILEFAMNGNEALEKVK